MPEDSPVKGFKSAKLPRDEALKRFEFIKQILVDMGLDENRIEAGGSIRRMKPLVGDLDIALFEPEKVNKAFYRKLTERMQKEKHDVKVRQLGDSQMSMNMDDFLYEFKKAPLDSKGAMLLHITGSADFNMGIRGWVKARGYSLNQYGLYDSKTGTQYDSSSEEAIFKRLGIPFVNPPDRIKFVPPPATPLAAGSVASLEAQIPPEIWDKVPEGVKEKLKNFTVPPTDENGVQVPKDVLWNKLSRQRYYISSSMWKRAHPEEPSMPFMIPSDLKLDRY